MPPATKSVLTASGAGLGNSSHRTCWSFVRFSAPDREAEYCDERACLSVCVHLSVCCHIFGFTRPIFTKFFVHVTYGRGSVLMWRRNDMLCTSGFIDVIMFAHKPRLLDVAAQLKRSAHAALGLDISCAQ